MFENRILITDFDTDSEYDCIYIALVLDSNRVKNKLTTIYFTDTPFLKVCKIGILIPTFYRFAFQNNDFNNSMMGLQQPLLPSGASFSGPAQIPQAVDREKIYQWINELSNPLTRETALLELS